MRKSTRRREKTKRTKKARKDNINEISLDNSDEDDSTSNDDSITTAGGGTEKSPDPHEIVMNEKSPLKVIKRVILDIKLLMVKPPQVMKWI
jgi:hypothetical protein